MLDNRFEKGLRFCEEKIPKAAVFFSEMLASPLEYAKILKNQGLHGRARFFLFLDYALPLTVMGLGSATGEDAHTVALAGTYTYLVMARMAHAAIPELRWQFHQENPRN